jgi:transposase-like protein
MKAQMISVPCGTCSGTGKVLKRKGSSWSYTMADKRRAFRLRRKGLSLRDIAKEMGIANAQTISNLIKSYHRTIV